MYVIATLDMTMVDGTEAEFQVGAEVEPYDEGSYSVGPPDISAPNEPLKSSRIASPDLLQEGWSSDVEDALVEVYLDHLDTRYDDTHQYSRENDYEL